MKVLKNLVMAVLAIIIIAFLATWILSKSINPETMKNLISHQISTLTHKPCQIKGAFSWQLLPRPGVKFTEIDIGNPKDKDNYALSIHNLLFNLQLSPLFRGQLVFSEMAIDGFKLSLNPEIRQANDHSQPGKEPSKMAPKVLGRFAMKRFTLSHGEIEVNNKGKQLVAKNLQLVLEQFNLFQEPFPIQIKSKILIQEKSSHLQTSLNFKGRLSLSPQILTYSQGKPLPMNLEGQLSLQDSQLNNLKIDKVNANIKTNEGSLVFNPLTLGLYSGESVGALDVQLSSMRLNLNQTASNLNGGDLMQDLTGHNLISGKMDYSINLSLPLDNPSLDQFEGKGHLSLKDGLLLGVNFNQLIDDLKKSMDNLLSDSLGDKQKGLSANQFSFSQYNQGSTPFKLASIQYHLSQGNLLSDALILQTDKIQITGDASLNMLDYALRSQLQATVSSDNANLQKVQQLLGGSFPISVSGTLDRPIIVPNLKLINPVLSRLFIKKVIDKPIKILGNQLKTILH